MLVDNAPSHKFVKSTNHKNENEESDSEISETESILSQNSSENEDEDDNNNHNNNYQILKLTNICLIYLPPNTMAHLQPIDAEIINNFKV